MLFTEFLPLMRCYRGIQSCWQLIDHLIDSCQSMTDQIWKCDDSTTCWEAKLVFAVLSVYVRFFWRMDQGLCVLIRLLNEILKESNQNTNVQWSSIALVRFSPNVALLPMNSSAKSNLYSTVSIPTLRFYMDIYNIIEHNAHSTASMTLLCHFIQESKLRCVPIQPSLNALRTWFITHSLWLWWHICYNHGRRWYMCSMPYKCSVPGGKLILIRHSLSLSA